MSARCHKQLPIKGLNFYRTRQCKRRAVEGGLCRLHTPAAEEERRRASEERSRRRHKAKLQLLLRRLGINQ